MTDSPLVGCTDLRRYELLAASVAGHKLALEFAQPGQATFTDGITVFVDVKTADVRAAILIQAALLGSGSFNTALVRGLLGQPRIARRYLVLEVARVLPILASSLPALRRVTCAPCGASDSAQAAFERAAGNEPLPEPDALWGLIRPRRLLATYATRAPAARPGSWALKAALTPTIDTQKLVDEDETTSIGKLLKLLSSPLESKFLSDLFNKTFGIGTQSGDGEPSEEAPVANRGAPDNGRSGSQIVVASLGHSASASTAPMGATRYPEWDEHLQRYHPDWCSVFETEPAASDAPAPSLSIHATHVQRQLVRLSNGFERRGGESEGDELDLDTLVEHRIDVRSGNVRHSDIYSALRRQRMDLGISILVDISASSGDPCPAGATILHHQLQLADVLARALGRLGARVAVNGFNSRGRHHVHFVRVKRFDEPYDGRSAARLSRMKPIAFTRLGAAIRHAGAKLEEGAGTSRRLLIILSDGFPCDEGYAFAHALADSRKALFEIQGRGNGCLGLSVGSQDGSRALREIFESATFAQADSASALLQQIGSLCRSALKNANTRRSSRQPAAPTVSAPRTHVDRSAVAVAENQRA